MKNKIKIGLRSKLCDIFYINNHQFIQNRTQKSLKIKYIKNILHVLHNKIYYRNMFMSSLKHIMVKLTVERY